MIEEHREVYNATLETKRILYEEFNEKVSSFTLIKEILPVFKKNESLKLANYSSAQQTIRRLDKAFNKFFQGRKKGENVGYPRFKNKDIFNTVEYAIYGDGCKIKENKLYLQNIGLIKCLWFSKLPKPKTLSITKKKGDFYVNFISVDNGNLKPTQTNKSIGLDFGLKTFITTSDGDKYNSPKHLKRNLKELGKRHRKIQKHEKGSREREKAKKALNKVCTKISNRRKDFNHKLSRKLINENDRVFIEDIKIPQLIEKNDGKKAVNRTYQDIAWGQFTTFLTYKAECAGKVVMKVPAYNTTKTCHKCQRQTEKSLNERVHVCQHCGHTEDRDVNAAKNILRLGLQSLGLNP